MRVRALLVTAAVGATSALGLAATAVPAAAQDTAQVSVLHAVPGLTVDVYANGDELLSDFEPGTLAGPLDLPADTYEIQVFPAGEGPDGDPAIETSVDVPGGANATVVAHLSEGGDPQLTAFVNDTAALGAGESRLTVRHVAAAPAVDVRAGGEVAIDGLTNPNEETLTLPAGTISADVVLAGTDTVAIGPADLDLREGTATIVYAWGSAADENLALAVQTIDGLHSSPNGVPGGQAGLVADDASPWATVGAASAALVLAAGAALALVRRTSAARER